MLIRELRQNAIDIQERRLYRLKKLLPRRKFLKRGMRARGPLRLQIMKLFQS